MALPSVTLNRQSGGIGRQAPGEDYISGYIHYFTTGYTLPTGFQSTAIHTCYSIADLVALGVDGTSSDETKATGTYLVTTAGTNGDVVTLTVTSPFDGTVITLGSYTKVSGDTTATLVATAIKNAINALTYVHGFTATSSTATVTITAAPSFGASLNSGTPIAATYSAGATIAGTITQFSGGVGSQYDIMYYHVREAFRMQGIISGKPQGKIYVAAYNISASPSTYANFTEVSTVQAFANGEIRQMGVYATSTAFATSHVTALQAQATTLQGNNTPLSIIYQGDFSGTSDLTTLSNLRLLTAKNVSVTIGQDGGNVGRNLYKAYGKSVGCLGTALGAVALAKVNESILWRGKFQCQDTLEYITLAFANGALQSASGSSLNSLMTSMDAYGYNFLLHETGLNGSFFNNSNTCISLTSDFSFIEDNRTIDKSCRLVRASIIPALGAPLKFNADGTLSADTIDYFQGLGDNALLAMQSAGEISAMKTIIDPTQNVQQTGILTITIQEVQTGVARSITVNIGYANSITQ